MSDDTLEGFVQRRKYMNKDVINNGLLSNMIIFYKEAKNREASIVDDFRVLELG